MTKTKVSLALLLLSVTQFKAHATQITIYDMQGKPLENAVVWLTQDAATASVTNTDKPAKKLYTMSQKNREFIPQVLVVPQNAQVEFPNLDSIMHHVYSFSAAKSFELKLYREKAQAPITFQQTGVVEIGCNIHDWMLSYIVVIDSMLFGITNKQGQLNLNNNNDNYTLNVWHSGFKNINQVESIAQQLTQEPIQYRVKQTISTVTPFKTDEYDGY